MVKKMQYANINQKKTGIAVLMNFRTMKIIKGREVYYNKMINPLKGFSDTKCTKQQNYKVC